MGRTNVSKMNGFSTVAVLVVVFVLLGTGIGGWYILRANKDGNNTGVKNNSNQQADTQTNNQSAKPSDPSEEGKYLVIKEWGVRVSLPQELQDKTSYLLGDVVTDSDNNKIQAAKIILKNDVSAGNECAIIDAPQGQYLDTAVQILRVNGDASLDSQRYKGTFKGDLLSDGLYTYHLNYTTPDCVVATTANQIKDLQSASKHLEKIITTDE